MDDFKKGDRVLVRVRNDKEWYIATFHDYDAPYYRVLLHGCEHWGFQIAEECIPFDETTFDLLGTKDDYKKNNYGTIYFRKIPARPYEKGGHKGRKRCKNYLHRCEERTSYSGIGE